MCKRTKKPGYFHTRSDFIAIQASPSQDFKHYTFTQHLADNLQHKQRNGKLPIITIIWAQTNNDMLLAVVLLVEPHTEACFL